jgi:hypothetical protein
MVQKKSKKIVWRDVKNAMDAEKAIDTGVLLSWNDGKHLMKILDSDNARQLIVHLSRRLTERLSDRLATEILVETLLIVLTVTGREDLMVTFLEEVVNSDDFEQLARVFIEVSLSSDVEENSHGQDLRATAVALICELGFTIQHIEEESPGHIEKSKVLLDTIATYLLSVGNSSIPSVRLSLMRYFCTTEYGSDHKSGFSRIMARFGYSMFDTLFQLLFNKKTEATALNFLLDNLPTALETPGDAQEILHETFKQYMLKFPERFSLFMHEMGARVLSLNPPDRLCEASESYYKHLVALFKVTSDLDHRSLGREVLSEIFRFESCTGKLKFSFQLQTSEQLRKNFRDMVASHRKEFAHQQNKNVVVSQFRISKRGRKPTLSKKSNAGFFEQIMFLGHSDHLRVA